MPACLRSGFAIAVAACCLSSPAESSVLARSTLASTRPAPSIPIAPGVDLPMVSLGTGSGQHGQVANATYLWLTAGGVGIDTAYDYLDEGEVAQGIAASNRTSDQVFITTKIPCGTYEKAKADIASNLQQLQTSTVDLMLIHFNKCEFGGSVAETWKALQEAKSAGQARSIGVSHFTISDLEKLSGDKPSVNQCSLSVRFHDDETIEYCRQHNITYMSFSPLCGGANGSSCPYGSVLTIPEVIAVAQAHKVSAAQVGLKWVAQQGLPMATAAWRQDYMFEDLDLWSWGDLTDEEMNTLSAVQNKTLPRGQ